MKRFEKYFLNIGYGLFFAFLFGSCASIPKLATSDARIIKTGKGAEDLVLDSFSVSSPRLLISCNDHRLKEKAGSGDIYQYDLSGKNEAAQVLPRVGEPSDLLFHPHGIFLSPNKQKTLLYVISHIDAEKKHPIIVYQVYKDSLVYRRHFLSDTIYSPNSVTAMSDGSFFITNDLGKRHHSIEAVLKQKKGSIVYCDTAAVCRTVAGKLSYANGLLLSPNEEYLYVSTTAQNTIFQYKVDADGSLTDRTEIIKIKGADNLRWADSGNTLITAAHLNFLAFAMHAKNPKKKSPSTVYEINIKNKTKRLLYANKGGEISAASGALIYNNKVYIGQVFQDFILEITQP